MADVVKNTKKDYFNAIRTMVEGIETVGEIPADEVLAFIDAQVAQLDAKAEKARAKAAEKKTEGDALRDAVAAVLTSELQTREQIFSQIEDESGELTVAKVGARLTQLVNAGIATKEDVKIDKRTVKGYRVA